MERVRIHLTNCSKCGELFARKPNESITCPECREKIARKEVNDVIHHKTKAQ